MGGQNKMVGVVLWLKFAKMGGLYRVSLRANAHHCTLSVIVTMKKTLHPMNTELTLSGS